MWNPSVRERCVERTAALLLVGSALLLVAGCGDDVTIPTPPPFHVTSVTLEPAGGLLLEVGEEEPLEARVNGLAPGDLPDDAPALVWSSSNAAVAQVSSSGVVSAGVEGAATIQAEAGGLSASLEVEVASEGSTVGPDGGTVVLADGAVRIQVPAGALDARVALEAEALEGDPEALGLPEGVPGTGWRIGPSGVSLAVPGTLRVAFDAQALPTGHFPEMLRAHRSTAGAEGEWTLEPAVGDWLDPDDDGDGILTDFEVAGSWMLAGIRPAPSSGIAAGVDHACALSADDTLWCWGGNEAAQVREDSDDVVPTPLPGPSGLRPRVLASGEGASCALARDGELWCWGRIARGTGGGGGRVAVYDWGRGMSGGGGGLAVGAHHACALDGEGSVWCWGRNDHGQLGLGASSSGSDDPVRVAQGDRTFTAIAAAGDGTLAIDDQGRVFAWGHYPDADGDGFGEASAPVQLLEAVTAGHPVTQVALGAASACALDGDGRLWCWGDNSSGQRGIGDAHDDGTLRPVHRTEEDPPFTRVEISPGEGGHVCALAADETLWCWGRNEAGELGRGSDDRCREGDLTRSCARTPERVPGLSAVGDFTVGAAFSCAVASETGTIHCWGNNERGQFGTGQASLGGTDATEAATGR